MPDAAKFCHNCGSLVSDAEGQAAASASMDSSAFRRLEEKLRADTIGEFEVERPLGKGGMAIVYLAREVRLGRKVAIKVLPPELTFGHGIERFLREARTAAALDHPNIIPIHRISSGDELFWYAMKFVDGEPLDRVLKERDKIPLDETIDILSPVAEALEYAHRNHVIHRDIKPANVMLQTGGRVIVADFGIAKALSEGTITASGSVVGTPYYMSPEQGMGQAVTGKSDQYSLAVMAYHMLSGSVPFEGNSAIEILQKHCMLPPPPLDRRAPDLPNHVYRAVHKALEKNPDDRLSGAPAFVDALRHETDETRDYDFANVGVTFDEVKGRVVGRLSTEIIDTPKPSPPRKRRVLPVLLTVALIAAAAGLGWWLTKGSRSGPLTSAETTTPVSAPPETTFAAAATSIDTAPTPSQLTPSPPSQLPPSQPTTGTVIVQNLPSDGSITANGRARTSPFTLPAGTHAVLLSAPGYVDEREQVTVSAGRQSVIRFDAVPVVTAPPMATLVIEIVGFADVSVDGAELGRQRGEFRREVTAGFSHALRFSRRGFVTVDTIVTLQPNEERRLVIRLERQE